MQTSNATKCHFLLIISEAVYTESLQRNNTRMLLIKSLSKMQQL